MIHEGFRTTSRGEVWTIGSADAGPHAPLLHFAHATGMSAALYRPLIERLGADFTIVASDARGHGRSRLPADPATLVDWRGYEADLAALLATFATPARLVLAGHSMGATVSLGVAARQLVPAAAVVMIEPAFVPFAEAAGRAASRAAGVADTGRLPAQAERRRARWPSRADIRAAYHGRGVFARWSDAALDAYLDGGLRSEADGSVELACAPTWEAATYRSVPCDVADLVDRWTGELGLLCGTDGSTVGEADAAAIAAANPGTIFQRVERADHFLPVEFADIAAAAIRAFA